jgi:predicted Zn-dependent protease
MAAKAADGLRDPDLSRRLLARARDGHAEQLDVLSGVRSAHGRLVRASRLVEAGQAGEAVDELTAVLETDPWWPEALELLAEAHEALGNADAAAEARDTLHHVDPYFAAAR